MEEGRWAARLLSEIGSARAAIAASYLSLWRTGGGLPGPPPDEPDVAPDEQQEQRPEPPETKAGETERA